MCEYSTQVEKGEKDSIYLTKSVKNLINKFEQLQSNYGPPCKVRTDSTFKVRKYLSLNTMNVDNNHSVPTLNQNVVNQFLHTQNSTFKTSGSVRESKPKSEQKKRSESLRKAKKTSDSPFLKYFRSTSDSKVKNENKNSTWYPNDAPPKAKIDAPKKKEPTITKQEETPNVQFRRKSYVMAMQTDYAVDINIDEPQKEENKNSYVSRILSKFEDKQNIKHDVKSDVDELFKNYHRKVKISNQSREELSMEINNVLLEKYKQLKYSDQTESAEDEEVECITLVYNEDDGKLTRYSEEECRNMETKYMITVNETQIPCDTNQIEEIQVIDNTNNENKSVVRDLCDKIQEQLDDVIKIIENEETLICEAKTPEQIESESKENIFKFWKELNNTSETSLNKPKPDEIKTPDMGYSTEENEPENIKNEDVPNITNQRRSSYLFSSVSTNSDVSDDKPRSSKLYCRRSQPSIEENKNKTEARNSFLNTLRLSFKSNGDEDNIKRNRSFRNSMFGDKKDDGRRNSYLSRRKSSFTPNSYKNETTSGNKTEKKRESFASCSSYDNEQINIRKMDLLEPNRHSFLNSRRSSYTSNKSETDEEQPKQSILRSESFKRLQKDKMDLLEPNRHSFLNSRRSSFTSNKSETDDERPKQSVLHSESFKRLSLQNVENRNLSKNSSFSSVSSSNSESNKPRLSRLYNGSFRRPSTPKVEEVNPPPLIKPETPRLSRLYSGKFRYSSKNDLSKKDDNNNTCEETKQQKFENVVLQFESDNEDETVESCNPYFTDISRDEYTKDWVQNTVEHLALQNVKEPQPVEEQQFSGQFRKTFDENGYETCTLYDEQNNPTIRLSCYDILLDVFNEEFIEEQKKIEHAEKQYRASIEDIQNNSQLACLIAELKSTEKNYIKTSLRRLVEDYMPEMQRKDIPLNLVGKVRTIFGNADILYESHKTKFLPALEASQNVEDIAACFLKYEEKIFKYYPLYTKNKPKSELIMRDYADFFKDKQEALKDRLDLSSYLLTPIQRMAKYCQLVKSMVKECEKEGKPSEKLSRASEMLAKLMSKGNDLIALDQILNFDGDLRQEGDLLLRDTFLVYPPNRKQSYEGMLFLFQESILITQITRYSGSEFFTYRDSIKVCDMGYTDNQAEPLAFKIWYRKRDQKNYEIRANKQDKQQKWVKEIFNLLWKQLEANKMRKKKEYEESGLNEIKVPLLRPVSEPNSKHFFKSRSNSTMKKKPTSETIWYSQIMKKFDFGDS